MASTFIKSISAVFGKLYVSFSQAADLNPNYRRPPRNQRLHSHTLSRESGRIHRKFYRFPTGISFRQTTWICSRQTEIRTSSCYRAYSARRIRHERPANLPFQYKRNTAAIIKSSRRASVSLSGIAMLDGFLYHAHDVFLGGGEIQRRISLRTTIITRETLINCLLKRNSLFYA